MKRILVFFACCTAFGTSVAAQGTLDRVRALYKSAEYEAALSVIDGLAPGDDGTPAAERYRVFCLMALDRAAEAERAAERVVVAAPLYDPGPSEVSPRIRAMYVAVRRRVLPSLARELYVAGKDAFDRQAFSEATASLRRALPIVEYLSADGLRGMDDLRIVIEGFLTLSRASLPPAVPALEPIPARAFEITAFLPETVSHLDAPTPPMAIHQDLPPWTYSMAGPEAVFRGAVDLQIDERGRVTDVEIVESIHPIYNADLVRAARGWVYEPARRGDRAVASRKRVEVVLRPR
jgi:hypothetical protein